MTETVLRMANRDLCVTSFGPSGYDLYGKTFLHTFTRYVDSDLVVYVEGTENIPDFSHEKIIYRNLLDVKGLRETLRHTMFPAARGLLFGSQDRNYKYDVHRFCRKSFAQIDAAVEFSGRGGECLYWIDADVEFLDSFDLPSLDGAYMAYLGRTNVHSCASFIGWNLRHPLNKNFFEHYFNLYVTGTVFALPEWHDSYIVDWLRHKLNVPGLNLAESITTDGYENIFDKVFSSAHHKKGNLKFSDK